MYVRTCEHVCSMYDFKVCSVVGDSLLVITYRSGVALT